MRCFLTDAVKNLNLPRQVFPNLYEAAKKDKPKGPERRFYYLTFTVKLLGFGNGKPVDLVVVVFLKTTESGCGLAHRGDMAVHLESEWDKDLNPL